MKQIKYFLLFLIVFVSMSTMYGAYLKNVPKKITQPDGTILHCFATGDEFYNWLHDSSGYTIVQDPQTGFYVYAVESDGDLLPTTYIAGKSNPLALNLKPNANISPEKRLEKRKFFDSITPAKSVLKSGTKNHGHINNLIFFVRFSDESDFGYFSNSYDDIMNMLNDSSSGDASLSMYNYYKQISYGKFSVTTTAYPVSTNSVIYSFQDTLPRSFYKPYHAVDNPNGYTDNTRTEREHDLIRRVVKFFADSVPALELDFDGDEKVDNVCFVISGGEGDWNTLLWPHRWSLFTGAPVYIRGKRVYDFNLIPIGNADLGTFTHEFMHTLGAPDLYRYNYSGTPVGRWDLMASTDDDVPQGLGAYVKHKYGNWIESIPEITSPGTYTLYPANGSSPEKTAYIFRPTPMGSEYILLEYRKTTSTIFESRLPGSGILIYRINNGIDGKLEGNGGYNGIDVFDEIYVYRLGGTPTSGGDLSNANFASDYGRVSFNLFTNPFPYYSDGSPMPSIMIKNITALGDSIQFTIEEVIDTLNVVPSEVILNCASKSNAEFTINSNAVWSITGAYTWLELEKTSGKGTQRIKLISLSKNTSTVDRVCTLNITTGSFYNSTNQRIVIRQKSCNTDITEYTDLSKNVILAPNPVSSILTVDYQQIGDFTDNNIIVYSVQGQRMNVPISHSQEKQLQLNVQALAAGIYYLRIQTSKGSLVKTFLVN